MKGVAGPRQTYLANAETEIFAPRRDNNSTEQQPVEVENTFWAFNI